jgi:cell fate (sporulation/competence/biofilm development) regulator YmcA (YheA/YmcA/DUF963 family)
MVLDWRIGMSEKEKLIEMIKNSEIILRYQRLEKVLNENQEIKEKLNHLKSIQKTLVQKKTQGLDIKEIELFYQNLLEEMHLFPLLSEYLTLQEEINEMIQQIAFIIEKGINEDIY